MQKVFGRSMSHQVALLLEGRHGKQNKGEAERVSRHKIPLRRRRSVGRRGPEGLNLTPEKGYKGNTLYIEIMCCLFTSTTKRLSIA